MYFSDRMAKIIEEQLDLAEFEIKEEIVSIRENILPSCSEEETCTEDTEIKGKFDLKHN